jgi:hypothetical protein
MLRLANNWQWRSSDKTIYQTIREKISMNRIWLLCSVLYFFGCGGGTDTPQVLSSKFSDIQKQTFNGSCATSGCHDASVQPQALLCLTPDSCYSQLMNHEIQAIQGTRRFTRLVVPGNPDSSFLMYKLTLQSPSIEYGDPMPARASRLPDDQITAIKTWILNGAKND